MPVTLQAHAYELAKAFDVRLIESDELKPEEAVAISHMRVVLSAPIREEMTYAVTLHEIGHLAAGAGIVPGVRTLALQQVEEEAAWKWARHYAMVWTPAMEQLAQWAEASYHRPTKPKPEPKPEPRPTPQPPIDWNNWK